MRSGDEFKEGLRDGRRVYVAGEGFIDDLTTHPVTRDIVDTYAQWYDRHRAPAREWAELLVRTDGGLVDMQVPRSVEDVRAMGRAFEATLLETGGNLTHDAAYGNLIALGLLESVCDMRRPDEEIENARRYWDRIEQEGTFLTLAGGSPTVGYKLRPDPSARASLRIVEERRDGLVVSGKLSMNTSTPFIDDAYVGSGAGLIWDGGFANLVVPVNAPGVTLFTRKPVAKHPDPFVAPLSHRFDEFDAQMWLDEVFVPRERVFVGERPSDPLPLRLTKYTWSWVTWHQLYGWYTKAEFSVGVALALLDAMGNRKNGGLFELVLDMIVDLQNVRTAITAAELDIVTDTASGAVAPNPHHIASASIKMLQSQKRLTEIVRILPGSSILVAPAAADFDDPIISAGLEEAFGGGGYTARQRAALLNLANDHANSALDARESAFEQHANGGMNFWRTKVRAAFPDYNRLANAVVEVIDLEMPEVDLESIRLP